MDVDEEPLLVHGAVGFRRELDERVQGDGERGDVFLGHVHQVAVEHPQHSLVPDDADALALPALSRARGIRVCFLKKYGSCVAQHVLPARRGTPPSPLHFRDHGLQALNEV